MKKILLSLFMMLSTLSIMAGVEAKPITVDEAIAGDKVVTLCVGDQYLYGKSAQNCAMGTAAEAVAQSNAVIGFKLEEVENGILFRAITPAGGNYALWGANPCYLNAQPSTTGVTFILGKDQDVKPDGSTWAFQADGSLKNVGNGAYFNGTVTSEAPVAVALVELVGEADPEPEPDPVAFPESLNSLVENATVFTLKAGEQYLYGPDAQNIAAGDWDAASAETNNVNGYILEKNENGYAFLRAVKADGSDVNIYGSSPCFLNSQPNVGGAIFNLGKDQDVKYGSTWIISEVEGGYTLQNLANKGYLTTNTTSETPVVWEFYVPGEEPELDLTVSPAFVVEGEEEVVALNDHSSVSVPAANALRVNFADNAAKIKHATYVINELVEDEFMGVVDIIEQEVASGTLSMSTIGYAEFDEPLTFYYGHKYNILIKAWDVTSDNLFDENFNMVAPIATFTCEFNGATDNTPAINMGEYQLAETMRNGMEINADEWEGFTVSYPENNVAAALAGQDALEYGAVMLVGTDATLCEDGVAIATESNAMSSEYSEVELFSNVELKAGKAYSIKIPAGGLKLVNMMNFMGDYDDSVVLWSNAEEIAFEFTTAAAAEPSIEICDLTADMFKNWTAADATGEVAGTAYPAYVVGESTDMPYGDGNVYYLNYADLSEYSTIEITATEGEPRLLFNRTVDNGPVGVELPRDKADFETVVENEDGSKTYIVDIAAIVARDGFAHLHAIKGANWAKTTVTSMALTKVAEEENLELAILPSLVLENEEVALNSHSEISVDMANGIKVAFENGASVLGVSYAINAMKAVSDDEGTTWVVDESSDIAVGEMSVNTIAFGEFEEPIYFEQGNKYQVKVTTYVKNETDTPDEVVTYYVINGSYVPELAVLPSLVLGEEEVALNDHSEASVDVIDGLKVAFENGASVLGVSYAINAMKAVSDEEGTTWVADESSDIAVGEMSMNTIAFVSFEDAIYFEQGNKYQIKITTYVNNGTDTPDEIVNRYIINGAYAPEIAVTPSLIDGDNEVALNDHSAVSVEAANAIKVQIDNAPEAIGVTYLINEMIQKEDEEGTFWTVGKELAAGEASMNTIAYAELETPITFAFGKKYQLTVSVMGQPADAPQELGTYTYEFNGATEVELAAGDYVIKNVESGLFLNGANSWGTKASAVKHGQFMTVAKVEDGVYTIDSHIANNASNHFLGADESTFVDSQAANHTIEMVAPGIFTILNNANGKYLAQNEDGLVNFNADEVTEAAKWQFITKEQLIVSLEDATAAEPADATALIGDANFSRNNQYIDMWNEKPNRGGDNTNQNAEKWGGNSQTFVSAQTLTDLPNGLYTLKAQGFYRYNNTTDNTNDVAAAAHADGTEVIYSYLFANNDSVALTSIADEANVEAYGKMPFSQTEASEAFNLGLYQNEINFEVTDNTITLGIAKVDHIGTDWTVWDNFELYYLGTGAVDPLEIEPAFVAGEEEITLNSHSNVSVESATALKVNVMNCPQAIGVTYLINEMNQNEDEEGTFWTVGKELAAGEASMNTIAYAEFENELVFEYGKKYQLSVSVFAQTAADPEEVGTFTYEFNGAALPAPDLAELVGKVVFIQNAATGEYLYGKDAQNTALGSIEATSAGVVANYKLEANEDGTYSFRCVTPAGGDYGLWGANPCYLNSQPNVGGVSFNLGKDQDIANGSSWNLIYDAASESWKIQSAANDGYLAGTTISAEAEQTWVLVDAATTAINGIATSATANGKYFQNGKVVIVRNGVKYNTNGAVIK